MKKGLPINMWLKVLALSALLCLQYIVSFSQGQANVWYFGEGFGLNFNDNPPSILSDGNTGLKVSEGEGVGSISDANGNLQFYSNGQTIWNRNHVAMPNGTGLNGTGTTCQTAVIVPVPGSTTLFYMIATSSGGSDAVKYVIVDMTLDGGLGAVTTASLDGGNGTVIIPSANNPGEGCVVIPKYDASNVPTGDYWAIFHSEGTSNNYYLAEITSSGITYVNTQAVGFGTSNSVNQVCIMKTNSCFDKIATSFYVNARVEVLPFNNVTGVISAPTLILNGTGAGNAFLNTQVYGLEFSPSGQFLYVTESGLNSRYTVFQFDITAGTGTNPAAVLASRRYFTASGAAPYTPREDRFGDLQLGPDGKIYFPSVDTNAPGKINCIPTPDVQWSATPTIGTGLEIEFWKYVYSFGTRYQGEGLPPVLKNLLTEIRIFYSNACEGGTTNFSYVFGGAASSISWNFGDPLSGVLNTSTSPAPSHVYNTAGTYTVTLTIIDNCGRTRTGTVDVIVKSGPQVSLPTNMCVSQNILLSGTGTNAANYLWSLNSNMSSPTGPSSTYTYNGTLPRTIYVQDPTPLATHTVGNTSASENFGADVGHTYFEIFTTVTIVSFQTTSRTNTSTTANLSLQNEAGTVTYWGPSAFSANTGVTQTYSVNTSLAPGRYRFFTSNVDKAFRNNTLSDGGRDVNGVFDVLGEKNGLKGGSFFNIIFEIPDPCGVRAYTLTENCPTPVTLIDFYGSQDENKINLNWDVANETNNAFFLVQRSSNGVNFETIGRVEGQGTTNEFMSYLFVDENPLNGKNYYRLAQTDINGTVTYSKIISFKKGELSVSVAPNPFTGATTIYVSTTEAFEVEVIDITGRIVEVKKVEEYIQKADVGALLSPGTYIARVKTATDVSLIKIVKE